MDICPAPPTAVVTASSSTRNLWPASSEAPWSMGQAQRQDNSGRKRIAYHAAVRPEARRGEAGRRGGGAKQPHQSGASKRTDGHGHTDPVRMPSNALSCPGMPCPLLLHCYALQALCTLSHSLWHPQGLTPWPPNGTLWLHPLWAPMKEGEEEENDDGEDDDDDD